MKNLINVEGTDSTRYTINTSHIVFYESVLKPFYNQELNTWEDSEEGSIIHLTNNCKPIHTISTKSKLDEVLLNQ